MNKQQMEMQMKLKIKELLPILKKNMDVGMDDVIFYIQRGDNALKIINYSERSIFNSILELFVNEKQISKKYSSDFISKMLEDYYYKMLDDESKIDGYIKEIIDYFFSGKVKDFFVFSEIENIRIDDDLSYDFIDCTIKILKNEDLPFDKEKYAIFNHEDSELINKPVIFTKVKAGETEKAKEIALHNFMVSITLLRLYFSSVKPSLKGCLLSGNQELLVYNYQEKNISKNLAKVGDLPLNNLSLNSKLYYLLSKEGINELKKSTKISQVVKECLYWFGLGLDEKHPSARLLNFVIVLESVLKKKGEMTELRRTVPERGAILLYERFEERKEVFKQLRDIYDIRSKVVHTGVLIDDKNMASLAGGYAKRVLIELIKKSKELNGDFDDFITSIDDIKLGKINKNETPNNQIRG